MSIVFIVNQLRDWPIDLPDIAVIPARTYLTDPAYAEGIPLQVCNLCGSERYQSLGYYVSLLGEARGHNPLPRINVIEDLQSQNLVRLITEGLDELLQRSLANADPDEISLDIYFGRDVDQQYDALSRQIFNLLPAPLVRADFERYKGAWRVHNIRALTVADIPAEHYAFLTWAARDHFMGCERRIRKRSEAHYDLAILHNPGDSEPPSNIEALKKFQQAAGELGLNTELITRADMGRLPEFDALFIRDTTSVNHYTFRFSRRATAQGLVVIDDPDSILRCSNKVYLAELLARYEIPTPRTLLVHRDNIDRIIPALGLPCVIKRPDSAFSLGVVKAENETQLHEIVTEFLEKSELVVAQEFLPTDYDWRIGVFDHKPLFACKYLMAPGHWQIIKREDQHKMHEGLTLAIPLDEVPEVVMDTALRAAALIGDGLYGVDLKQIADRCYVIEVNDNPNVDAGNEDAIRDDEIYREIMGGFLKRIESLKNQSVRSIGK